MSSRSGFSTHPEVPLWANRCTDGLQCVDNGQACLPNDLAMFDDPGEEPSDTSDSEEGVTDPGESSDEETANMY